MPADKAGTGAGFCHDPVVSKDRDMGPLPAQRAELRPFEPTRCGMHEEMTSATALGSSYLIAARRTALGRPGGLHRSRRLEDLTAPIVLAALQETGTRAFVEAAVDEQTRAALAALAEAAPLEPYGGTIRAIAEYALGRES